LLIAARALYHICMRAKRESINSKRENIDQMSGYNMQIFTPQMQCR